MARIFELYKSNDARDGKELKDLALVYSVGSKQIVPIIEWFSKLDDKFDGNDPNNKEKLETLGM